MQKAPKNRCSSPTVRKNKSFLLPIIHSYDIISICVGFSEKVLLIYNHIKEDSILTEELFKVKDLREEAKKDYAEYQK